MTVSAANTLWARSIVDELARAGVRELVVAPGSRSTPVVLAAAADGRLKLRVHLDERSAAFFALGVGKAAGRPAAVLTTSGTAVANLLPAVVEASESGVPLLVLTADRPPRLRGADANQAIDQAGIFGDFVRESFDPGPPSLDGPALRHLRGVAARAVAASVSAAGPGPGPVHLNLPFDKPLEPVEPPADFVEAHPLAATGRPDGAPFVRISTARAIAADARLDEVAALFAGGDACGVIVAGPLEEAARVGPAVVALGEATGWPVLADPLSGARFGRAGDAHVVAGYDLFLDDPGVRERLAPSVIVRVGATPTSASLQRWILDHNGVPHVVLDAHGRWKDSGATATQVLRADAADALWRLAERVRTGSGTEAAEWADEWRALWRRADEAARRVTAARVPGHEGDLAGRVVEALDVGTTLVVSSSMPVRDVDGYAHPADRGLEVLGNRGASGIDGVVSTAFGVASQRDAPTVCLIGDVAFFHDRNGLLWSREADASVVFVLIDNDGGGIFHMLPVSEHEPHFTPLFATPHGLDPRAVIESHGIGFVETTDESLTESVRAAVKAGGSVVIHVRTDREENRSHHRATLDAVAGEVRAALAEPD